MAGTPVEQYKYTPFTTTSSQDTTSPTPPISTAITNGTTSQSSHATSSMTSETAHVTNGTTSPSSLPSTPSSLPTSSSFLPTSPSVSSKYEEAFKPKPKPRRNYQTVELSRSQSVREGTGSPSSSPKIPPAIAKKPQNYSPVILKKPAPLPPSGDKSPAPSPGSGSDKPPAALPDSKMEKHPIPVPTREVQKPLAPAPVGDSSGQSDIPLTEEGIVDVMAVIKKLSQTLPRVQKAEAVESGKPPAPLPPSPLSSGDKFPAPLPGSGSDKPPAPLPDNMVKKPPAPVPTREMEKPPAPLPTRGMKKPPAPLPTREMEKSPAPVPTREMEKPPIPVPAEEAHAADISGESDMTGENVVDVMAVVKKLSQTLPRMKKTEISGSGNHPPSPPPPSQPRRKSEDSGRLAEATAPPSGVSPAPNLPKRIDQCFVDSKVNTVIPLPPKPRQPITHSSFSLAATPESLNWNPTGETMTLAELADTHSSRFPLKIYLLDGYYGQTAHFTLSSSDMFDVHFAKRTQVMTVRDSLGTNYSIPLNSAIQFGMIYKPRFSKEDESPQTVFQTVGELLSLDPLPKVVRATSQWGKLSEKGGKAAVEENELLIVKGVYKPALRNKRALKCYSVQNKIRKLLPEECEGNFSVAPEQTKLHVYEFSMKLKDIFPCKAMMYLYDDSVRDSPLFRSIPKSLFKKPMIIINVTVEASLTATSVSFKPPPNRAHKDASPDYQDDGNITKPKKSLQLMEIPLDSHLAGLEVEIMEPPNEAETEKMYMNTQEVIKKMDKQPYMILLDKGSDSINDAQSLFYMQVRSDKRDLGVELQTSKTIYERIDTAAPESASGLASPTTTPTKTPTSAAGKRKNTYEHNESLKVLQEDGNQSDSSDDHVYEMIDDEIRRNMTASGMSPALQQLAPTSPPHYPASLSPPHYPTSLAPAHYQAPISPLHYPITSLPPSHYEPSQLLPGQWLHERYNTQGPPAPQLLPQQQAQALPQALYEPPPTAVPSQLQSSRTYSYVKMVPGPMGRPQDSSTTPVPPNTVLANRAFLKDITVSKVSLLCIF